MELGVNNLEYTFHKKNETPQYEIYKSNFLVKR